MRKFKTTFTALALGCVFALSGCNGNPGNHSASGKPDPDFSETVETTDLYDYTGKTEKEFQFKTFVGVPSNMRIYNALETSFYIKTLTDAELDTYYKELSEAGFTVADGPYFAEDQAHYRKVLDLAQKYGMKQMVGELVVNGISLSAMLRGEIIDSTTGKPAEYTDEQIKAHLEACLGEFKDHPAFYGFSYWDEPNATKYDTIARIQKLFQEVFPGKILYVNLLPITVDLSLLGYTNPADRIKYTTDFIEKIDVPYISYDRYPLYKDASSGKREIQEDFLYNMQVYRQAADIDGRELWTYLQSTGHLGAETEYLEPKSIADFRWQVNSFLSVGGSGISWFTTFAPPPVDGVGTQFNVGPYDRKGRKTDIYYKIKAVQEEVHAFEDVYFNFDWKNVMTVLGKENEVGYCEGFTYLDEGFAIDTHERIAEYSCQQDTLIGCFEDKDGCDGFMITNYANPADNKTDRVSLTFNDAKAVAVYRLAEKRVLLLNEDGTFNITLQPGEGIFVVPLK